MTFLALALLAIPILFGLARLVSTSTDWRYLAVALVSTLVAMAVMRRGGATLGATRTVAAILSAALGAALAALAVGARSGLSIAVVAINFAICSGTGAALWARARGSSASVG